MDGWSIDASQTAALVTNALGMAIENRSPQAGTILHSDHGTQGELVELEVAVLPPRPVARRPWRVQKSSSSRQEEPP